MPDAEKQAAPVDWNLTTWEGSRREQLRRWAALSLEEILLAQEEMQQIAERLTVTPAPEQDERTPRLEPREVSQPSVIEGPVPPRTD